jgi:hypothetical protein
MTRSEILLNDNDVEISYKVQYFETNQRNRGDSWSLRQTGIYQGYSGILDKATWIMLNLSKRIRSWFEDYLRSKQSSPDHPLLLHILLLIALTSTYPEYLQHLFMQLEELVCLPLFL